MDLSPRSKLICLGGTLSVICHCLQKSCVKVLIALIKDANLWLVYFDLGFCSVVVLPQFNLFITDLPCQGQKWKEEVTFT